jgi:tryptophan-rich sensory protein
MKVTKLVPLAGFLLASFSAAAVGGAATATSIRTWYPTLIKPVWNPPNWVFGPVWTLLYCLMAIAAWRVWQTGDTQFARRTFRWFAAQLSLNLLWSVLFFGLRSPGLAFAEVVIFWAMLVVMLRGFWRADRIAAALWAPYVAWVSFATVLNGTIWWLNR